MSKNTARRAAKSNVPAVISDIVTTDGSPADSTATESPTEQPVASVDPFADIPTVTIGDDVSFDDFTDTATSDPRKYGNINAAAVADRLPTAKNWKYERAMLTPGTNRKELKQGSVYGDIQQIVQAAGRSGIPAYVVATKLRRMQVNNKRSHYCNGGVPPIGWSEGWINTAITKSIAGVHPTKEAPALRSEVTEGEAAADAAQAKIAANG